MLKKLSSKWKREHTQHNKAIYYKLATSYSMVKRKKLSYKFKNYTMPTLIVSTEHKIENAIHSTQTRKKK